MTLAAYAVPVSLAYASLAGLPPQVGMYGYIAGGIGYALAGSSRFLAVGPTSAISLMVGGTVASMAGDDAVRFIQIATDAALIAGILCLIAWLCRLSVLVKLIGDSVLTGFKAGAGLTIAITQLPAMLGVSGGGHAVSDRLLILAGQLPDANPSTLALGLVALALLAAGERLLPGQPVALAVVIASIAASVLFGLPRFGVAVTGAIPAGLPMPRLPELRLHNHEGLVPLAAGCVLLAYIEGVAAARTFALKHGDAIDPRREFLGLGIANLATALIGGYPVAGGLSQTAVNERAGARSRLALVFASVALALCLIFLTGLVAELPRAVLGAVVLMAVSGLIDVRAMAHMWRVSLIDFLQATVALAGVLLLGILQGILLAALVSVLMVLIRYSAPHVAVLGRIPGTAQYSDMLHHPENVPPPGALAMRPEASLLYLNAEHVLAQIKARLNKMRRGSVQVLCLDLSASPRMDLMGARMVVELQAYLQHRNIRLAVTNALTEVRALLAAEGLGAKADGITEPLTLADALRDL